MLLTGFQSFDPDAENKLVSDWTTPDDYQDCVRHSTKQGQNQFLAVRALARFMLQNSLNISSRQIQISRHKSGRPIIAVDGQNSDIEISFSHSRNHVGVAITTLGKIGIDVEFAHKVRDFRNMFGQIYADISDIDEFCDDRETGYQIWTSFESFYKASGRHPSTGFLAQQQNSDADSINLIDGHIVGRTHHEKIFKSFTLLCDILAKDEPFRSCWPTPIPADYGVELCEVVSPGAYPDSKVTNLL
jgi:phosphopantetheinyl transferase